MTILLAWLILNYGLSNILVYGSIFEGVRETIRNFSLYNVPVLSNLCNFVTGILSCMMCCSTWTGFFTGLLVYSPTTNLFEISPIISWFFDGILASGGVWIINAIVEWFEENRTNK